MRPIVCGPAYVISATYTGPGSAHRARLLLAGDVAAADAYLNTYLHIEAGPEPEEIAA